MGKHFVGNHAYKSLVLALLVVFGLSGCGKGDKSEGSAESSPQELTFSFGQDGTIIPKDIKGGAIGDRCSTNPKDPNACPIYTPGHEIQFEQLASISVIQYHGSPQCYLVFINGVAYVIPSAAYCKK